MKSRRIRWAGHVEGMGERRVIYSVLMELHLVKCSVGRPTRRRKDNIKINIQEVI